MKKIFLAVAILGLALASLNTANAGQVYVSGYVGPSYSTYAAPCYPNYYYPPPVVYRPAPVVVYPPRVVVSAPVIGFGFGFGGHHRHFRHCR